MLKFEKYVEKNRFSIKSIECHCLASTMEVIDPTVYQMDKEYNYKDYHTRFLPQLSKNVKDTLAALELNIDKNKFKIKKSKNGTELITKSKKINNDTV